ncbi:MAG: hypothetical protein RLP45_11920, partial [Haliea sp.]
LSGGVVAGSAALWQLVLPALAVPLVALFIVALGLASLLWFEYTAPPALLRGMLQLAALTQLYLLWHLLFAGLAPAPAAVAWPLVLWVALSFTLFYVAQVWLRCYPQGRFARTVYPWAYCGFYLDETFTRLTFRIWPLQLSPIQAQTLTNRIPLMQGNRL